MSAHDILALADAIQDSEVIEIHSGDREPGSNLSERGKQWIVEGLRLLADKEENDTRRNT